MGSKGKTTLEVGADGVAIITLVHPPVNALSFDVLYSLKQNYDEALRRNDVKAIVVTGAKGKFSGGFDISAFGGLAEGKTQQPKPGYVSIEIISDTLEAAKKPSVAAIDGIALGGGLEIAMACHARVSTPTAQLGLPELQLGILPGFGGTQRLPRLVGLSKALEMILTSKPVKAEEGHALGLVDAVVSPAELVNTARQWALDILERRRPWVLSLYKTDKIEPLGEAREIFKFARAEARKQAPNLRHPIVTIDVIEEGIVSGPRAGLLKEAEASEQLIHSDTSKSLIHIFFSHRGTSKVPGVTDLGLVPRRVKTVAILGGGLMGSGIATALILGNYHVILKEVNEKFLDAGINRVKANLQSRVKKGKMSEEKFEKTMSLLRGVLDYEGFKDVDMVIEAVIENVSLKQQIFADLEKYCKPHCILASNTSTIDLNLIGEKTKSQDRIVGAHFFSPAHVMPLLEIVRTQHTSPQVIVDLLDVGKKIRKIPVVVGNCTGFAVNRMFFPYTQAALLLVEHGADVYLIDKTITKFGMPMGPFRLADLVGFGVAIATGMQFVMNFSDRTYKSMIIPLMQEDKRAGETTRKGFYMYDDKRKAKPDPEIKKYIKTELRNQLGGTVELVGCYIHPLPVLSVKLSTIGNEIYVCVSCGLLVDKNRTLFIYKLAIQEPRVGCPSFVGHTSVILPYSKDDFGRDIALESSCLLFTPDGQSLVLLDSMKTPYCREGRVDCLCSTCTSNRFEENALKIVQVKPGYVSLVAKLKTVDSVQCILVYEPNHLVAVDGSGKLHLWEMNSTWSAKMTEFVIPVNDLIYPCIVELKRILKCAPLVVGHNGFGEFAVWDISRRVFLSRFSTPSTSTYQFIPISIFSWQTHGSAFTDADVQEHINGIMDATEHLFLEHNENNFFLPSKEEDIAIWLLVQSVSESDAQHDYTSSDHQINPVRLWRLALLVKNLVIMGSPLDPRAAAINTSAGHGIIGTHDGLVYLWELSTGIKLGTLHDFKGGTISCIATDDSRPRVLAVASDGGQLLVYLHGQNNDADQLGGDR